MVPSTRSARLARQRSICRDGADIRLATSALQQFCLGLLDIKTKVGETPEGYEIFQPRGKFQFPVGREDLATILSHLKVDLPLDQDSYSFEAFVAMARRHPDLCPVTVEKMRFGFTVDGIICEYAQVWFNGALIESACAESENYAGMQQVVDGLGLAALPNTNYLKAAKRVVGMI